MKKQTVEKTTPGRRQGELARPTSLDSTMYNPVPCRKYCTALSLRGPVYAGESNVLIFVIRGYLNLVVQKKRIAAAVGEESKERRCMRNSCCLFRLCVGSSEGDGDAGERHGWSGAREVASRRE
jgi:hypothetical protein